MASLIEKLAKGLKREDCKHIVKDNSILSNILNRRDGDEEE